MTRKYHRDDIILSLSLDSLLVHPKCEGGRPRVWYLIIRKKKCGNKI
jgi:hypothetical protein